MKKFLDASRLLVGALSLLAMGGAAVAHEGHDHSLPSGLWPKHAKTETQAVTAVYAALESSESSTDLGLRITAWKLSDGSTGYSSQDARPTPSSRTSWPT